MPEFPKGKCVVEWVHECFHLSILNSKEALVSKMIFDHNAGKQMSQFIKHWLEFRELRPVHIGVDEVEFNKENVEEGYYIAKQRLKDI